MALTIYPYLLNGSCWVFDDARTGLKEEAFVLGMSEMISRVVEAKGLADAEKGFTLTFDGMPFGHDVELTWLSPEAAGEALGLAVGGLPDVGNWYRGEVLGQAMVGWLCPALFLYFQEAPKKIYAKAEPLPAGVDPIWHIAVDDPRGRRFVSAGEESRERASRAY